MSETVELTAHERYVIAGSLSRNATRMQNLINSDKYSIEEQAQFRAEIEEIFDLQKKILRGTYYG